MDRKLNGLLANPGIPWFAAALMLVICLPALRAGFVGDDYYHRAILLGEGETETLYEPLLELFRFVPAGDGADHLREVGVIPWWTHPDLELGFLRPVTAATHLLDYALWPDTPLLQHTQSLLWFGAAVLLVGLTYRRVHGPTAAAGLAVLLFAIEDAHSMNIGWLANRNATIALVLGLLAFLAHVRWRRQGAPVWLGAALVAFTAGLLAGETAIGILAYIVAWQLTMDTSKWPQRFGALVPYAGIVVGWRITYDALGYGCSGSGLYIDPTRQPIAFVGALLERWPVMFGSLWSQLTADLWAALGRSGRLVLCGFGLVVCAFVAVLLSRLVQTTPRARFWALGMTLALVPVAATFPMNRLLLIAGIGAFGLIAMLAEEVGLLGKKARDRRSWVRRATMTLVVLHVPLAVVLLIAGLVFLPVFNLLFTAGARLAPRDPALADQSLIFVNGHDFPCAYTILIRRIDNAPAPRRIAILGPLASAATVTREDERTLLLATADGWFEHPIDRLMRGADPPFELGQRFRDRDFEATIRSLTPDGRPLAVAFTFRSPLEDGSYRWVHWRQGRLENWPITPVGGTAFLSEESLLALD